MHCSLRDQARSPGAKGGPRGRWGSMGGECFTTQCQPLSRGGDAAGDSGLLVMTEQGERLE
jgi:hypothetical protein